MKDFKELYCAECGSVRTFTKERAIHCLHLAWTVVSVGLWAIGWAGVAILEKWRPWRCTICHVRHSPSLSALKPVARFSARRNRGFFVSAPTPAGLRRGS